jgi:hypothetical protein
MVISGILLSCQNIRYYFAKKCNFFIFTVDINNITLYNIYKISALKK